MQSSRLLAILLRLQAQGRVSAQALAEALEVSVRTVYRDIDALSAAGVPVYAEKGRRGGFVLREGYRTRLTGLDRPEAETLFFAGAPFAAEQLGLGAVLETTRLKLLAALPEAMQQDAQRVASRFHLDPVAWFQGPEAQGLLPELATAVWTGRMLNLHYRRWQGEVERRVAPLGLVLKAGLWYLVAAVGSQVRSYRVSAILAMTVEDEAAPVLPGFELQRYWQQFCADYEARMASGRARVRVHPAALRRLSELSLAVARAVADAAPPAAAEAWWELEIPIESIPAAVGELLRLGPQVQALEPPELRQALAEAVQHLQAIYPPLADSEKR